jgi:hypothetical protein
VAYAAGTCGAVAIMVSPLVSDTIALDIVRGVLIAISVLVLTIHMMRQ